MSEKPKMRRFWIWARPSYAGAMEEGHELEFSTEATEAEISHECEEAAVELAHNFVESGWEEVTAK
jgi:hypothetical protein